MFIDSVRGLYGPCYVNYLPPPPPLPTWINSSSVSLWLLLVLASLNNFWNKYRDKGEETLSAGVFRASFEASRGTRWKEDVAVWGCLFYLPVPHVHPHCFVPPLQSPTSTSSRTSKCCTGSATTTAPTRPAASWRTSCPR